MARCLVNVGGGGSSSSVLTISEQTGASYTLASSDHGTMIDMNSASAQTLTVPLNSSVALSTGFYVIIRQKGAGQVTVSPSGGVTVNPSSTLKTGGQYSIIVLIKVDTDTWAIGGDMSA
jgi:hypothetical protein